MHIEHVANTTLYVKELDFWIDAYKHDRKVPNKELDIKEDSKEIFEQILKKEINYEMGKM